jgi:hypothetical protein
VFEAWHCGSTWKATGSLGGLKERNTGTEEVGQGTIVLNEHGPYLSLEKSRL